MTDEEQQVREFVRETEERARALFGAQVTVYAHVHRLAPAKLRAFGLTARAERAPDGERYLVAQVDADASHVTLYTEHWKVIDADAALAEARRRYGADGCAWAEPVRGQGLVFHVGEWSSDETRETYGEGATWEAAFEAADAQPLAVSA